MFVAVRGEANPVRIICWTGQDATGGHWEVIRTDESDESVSAQVDAILIAQLLNKHYADLRYSAETEQKARGS